jgi:hypothetical protein
LKAPKFSKPNERAYFALFDDIVEEFTSPTRSKSTKSSQSVPTSPVEPSSPLARIFGSIKKARPSVRVPHQSMGDLTSPKTHTPSPLSAVATTPRTIAVKIKQEELAGSLSNTEKMMSTMADTSPIRTTLESS